MKVITISGRAASGKSTLAMRRYNEYKSAGKRVAMIDDESYGCFYSYTDRGEPDVKIVTKMTSGDLTETTTEK